MLFDFNAINSSGNAVKGTVEATDANDAIVKLRSNGYFPTKIQKSKVPGVTSSVKEVNIRNSLGKGKSKGDSMSMTSSEVEQAKKIGKWAVAVVVLGLLLLTAFSSYYIVEPGNRGVKVTLGKTDDQFASEGFGLKTPFLTEVHPVSVRQQTRECEAECYSSDLQQVNIKLKLIYSIPERSIVNIYKSYFGDPFDSLIVPRAQEALKEQTALMSAEQIVKQREQVKSNALKTASAKIGNIVEIKDLVIENITLSKQLEEAIEQKMVQEQNASKAKFEQERRKIEADTKIIEAKAEAEAINIRGKALRENPDQITLQIVEKWDGRSPMVIGSSSGNSGNNASSVILPITVPQNQK
jgi:prohibitin 2